MRAGITASAAASVFGLALIAGASAALAAPAPKCLKTDNFQVVYREKADSVGSDILVQKLDGKPRKCAFDRKPGDFKIGGDDDANYVLGAAGDILVIDQGTGPDRTLQLYDLQARKAVLTQDYDDSEPVKIAPGKVTFRAVTGPANASNCPDFKSFEANGLGAALTQAAEIALPAAKMTLSGATGCIARQ